MSWSGPSRHPAIPKIALFVVQFCTSEIIFDLLFAKTLAKSHCFKMEMRLSVPYGESNF